MNPMKEQQFSQSRNYRHRLSKDKKLTIDTLHFQQKIEKGCKRAFSPFKREKERSGKHKWCQNCEMSNFIVT